MDAHLEAHEPAPRLPRVLVVEDVSDIREMICELLTERGYDVRGAKDGADAIAQLDATRLGCTIVTDLSMPLRDGWSLLRHLSTLPHAERLYRVVVVSASDDSINAAQLPTVSAVLSKPLDVDRFYRAVADAAEENRSADQGE